MKLLIQRLFGIAGFELRKKHGSRASLEGVLTQLQKKGFSPKGIVDVGAAFGDWTRTVHNIFPDAVYVLFEPLTEYAPTLTALSTEYPVSTISIRHTLLGSQSGEGILNVHADLVGSSMYKEVEDDSLLVTEARRLPCTTLDIALRGGPEGPLFLKIDAQGAEQAILSGATSTLARTEVIQLELSLLGSIQGAPLLHGLRAVGHRAVELRSERSEDRIPSRRHGRVPHDVEDHRPASHLRDLPPRTRKLGSRPIGFP